MPRLRFYLLLRIESQSVGRTRRKGLRRTSLQRKIRGLISDLLEDTLKYIVLLLFILASIMIAEVAISIARTIAGEVPSVLEYGIYLGDASLLLKFIIHTYRSL